MSDPESAPTASGPGGSQTDLAFLRKELRAGLLSARVALETANAREELTQRENASIAYGTVLYFLDRAQLSRPERQELEVGLAELRGLLTQLGVRV